jgi:hypothetical protein
LAAAFAGPKAELIRGTLQDQNEGLEAESIALAINQVAALLPRVPPALLEALPQLPQQVEFAFSGRTLIVRDTDADVVVDFATCGAPRRRPARNRVRRGQRRRGTAARPCRESWDRRSLRRTEAVRRRRRRRPRCFATT